jgi:SAM-dependent methyltransferase
MYSTDKEWEEWGEKDPYYAVLSIRRYRADSIGKFRDEFFRTGEEYVAKTLSLLEARYGQIGKGRCLDLGCGVGRVTLPLARQFAEVVGLDVSNSMLAEAQRNLRFFGVTNTTLGRSDDLLSFAAERKFDFVHSYITLQHVPVARGYRIFAAMLDLLNSDGAFFAQFCIGLRMPMLSVIAYNLKRALPAAKYPLNVLKGKPWNDPSMQMNVYDLHRLLEIVRSRKFMDVSVHFEEPVVETNVVCDSVCIYAKR